MTLSSQVSQYASIALCAIDHVCDLTPLVSTVSNTINLGLKKTTIDQADPTQSSFKPYVEHLQQKSQASCMVMAVPVVGNVYKLATLIMAGIAPKKEEKKEEEDPMDKFINMEIYDGSFVGSSTLGMRLEAQEHPLVGCDKK
jgi:CO dehydrogenase/acetyl-CoA synthase alpha subunit